MTTDTTEHGLPFPLGNDPVLEGDDRIADLARALDPRVPWPGAEVGLVTFPVTNAGATTSVVVTFAAGRFTEAPIVTLAARASAPQYRLVSAATGGGGNPPAAAFTAYYANTGTSAAATSATWHAMQAPPAAAALLAREAATGGADLATATVTCPTSGCGNHAIALQVPTEYLDDDGQAQPVDAIQCGVCGAELDPTPEEDQ